MDEVVIRDYCRMTNMDENPNWMKLTYLLSNFPLNHRPPLYIYLYFNIINKKNLMNKLEKT